MKDLVELIDFSTMTREGAIAMCLVLYELLGQRQVLISAVSLAPSPVPYAPYTPLGVNGTSGDPFPRGGITVCNAKH